MEHNLRSGLSGLLIAVLVASLPLGCGGGPWTTFFELLPVYMADPGLCVQVEFDRPFITRGNRTLRMDVFRPTGADQPTPAVILVHGGFWLFGERYLMYDWAADLAGQGYTATSIDYRLLHEGGKYPAPVADVLAAVAHLRDHAVELNVDPERIALFGVSAGAHLALLAGMAEDASVFSSAWPAGESANVRAVVEIYGPTDFTADPRTAKPWQEGLVAWFLNGSRSEASDRWRQASPVTHVRADGPAVFILHGTADPIVPPTQALFLRDALEAAGQPYLYFAVPGEGHSWGSVWNSPPALAHRMHILQFLEDNL